MSLLIGRDLVKSYPSGADRVHALDHVSLELGQGELVSIMGPSGSGKSTLMHVIGLLERPDGGALWFDGQEVASLGEDGRAALRNRKIGFVFQSYNLLPRFSALENVEVPLVYGGVPLKVRRERARAMLAQFGLGDRLDHRPSQLSGGQQQRVAIARAMVTQPRLVLADEPTGALDSETGRHVLETFATLARNGTTVVVVTHDPSVAAVTDRVLHLKDGRLSLPAQGGKPDPRNAQQNRAFPPAEATAP